MHSEHNLKNKTTILPTHLGSAINTPKQVQTLIQNKDPVKKYATPNSSYQVNTIKECSYTSVVAAQPTQSLSQP